MNQYKRHMIVFVVFALFGVCCLADAQSFSGNEVARGYVFNDLNRDGVMDSGEEGIANVCVSNGEMVVATDTEGYYEIPVENDTIVFVIKPRDWMTPVNRDNLPQFYYIHKPEGSPEQKYPGVEPTGPLPDQINFPLYKSPESDQFSVIFFADPQPHTMQEVDYVARDVVEELVGTDAIFGVTLGDIVGDKLDLFEPLNAVIGQVGIPWYNVIGNHDLNFDPPDNNNTTETFQRVYGPAEYAFQHGRVHFITFNSTYWLGDKYIGKITTRQLNFIKNYLEHVPKEDLIVLMMHIPLVHDDDQVPGHALENPEDLYPLLADFPHTFSISGHWHNQANYFIDKEQGWLQDKPHHHLVQVTVGGSWWSGHMDEFGVPHATMDDGRPNGYNIISFDGNQYSVRFKGARKPAEFQMNIYAPAEFSGEHPGDVDVIVNVFSGSSKSVVKMRIKDSSEWIPMERFIDKDLNYERLLTLNDTIPEHLGKNIPNFYDHSEWKSLYSLWQAKLPGGLDKGTYTIEVEATDMFNQIDRGYRVIRITD